MAATATEPKIVLQAHITREQHEALMARAEEQQAPVAYVVRRILQKELFDTQKKK